MPRPPGPLRSPSERRQTLLDAAIGVVRTDGPGTTMEAMASAGMVTKPILYRHFGDRQGLVAAIGERFLTDLNEAIATSLRGDQSSDGSLLRATIDAYMSLVEADTELYRFLVQQDARSGNETTSAFVAQVAAQVTDLLDATLRAADRDPAPAELWAYGIIGMVHAAGDWWAERRTSMSRDLVVNELTWLLWRGLDGIAPT